MLLHRSTRSRLVRRGVILFAAVLLAGMARAETVSVAGTLPEDYLPGLKTILATAFERSPKLILAEYERAVGEARIYSANAPRLPSVRGSSEYASNQTTASGNNSSQSRASGFFYRFEASQALYHWGALQNQSRAAQISLLVEQKKYALAARELGIELRKAYLALIVEKVRLRQGREALRIFRADLAVLQEKNQAGLISAAVLEGEKLRGREIALELDRGEAELAANRRRFARLAGVAEFTEEQIPDDVPRLEHRAALATALTAALLRDGAKSTLEYEVYDLRVREALLREKIARTGQLPKFFAGAAYSLENNTAVIGNSISQEAFRRQSVSVSAQWSIFDGFATRGAVREALAVRRLHERTLAARVEATLQDAQIMERSLALDAEQLNLAETRHSIAVEGRKRVADEAALGNLPAGDVERAQLNILQADAANVAARVAYLGRWCDFVALAGDDPVLQTLPARYAPKK
jgi:outer membrane protein TolC